MKTNGKEVATSLFHHAGHILSGQLEVLITVASLEKGDRKKHISKHDVK